jgi:DNA-binding PadR family transcriptional regulator
MLGYIALGMVLDEALTGYEIKQEIELVDDFYKASYGSLYPSLKKMTEKGYLTMNEELDGNRLKKYYLATEQGRKFFIEWLSTPLDLSKSQDSVLIKIYFFGSLPEATRKQLLGEYELYYQKKLYKLKEMEKQFSDIAGDPDKYFMFSTLYFGLQRYKDNIRWLKHISEKKALADYVRKDD